MGNKHLCLIFGITPSTCIDILNKMLLLVVHKLKRHPVVEVKFPDAEKMERFAHQINEHEPIVNNVIGFMDGLALQSKCTSEPIKQNSMYRGYYSDTMVNNLLVPMVKYFFVQSTFLVAGMMDPLWPKFCHIFKVTLAITKCVLIRAFPVVEMQHQFLLVQLVRSKLEHLLLICKLTCYIYLMFMCHCDMQVNGA
jgi:hypothetical protein